MEDRYVVEITKEGKTPAENVVCFRLQMEESRIQAVIAAASGLPVPRAKKAKVPTGKRGKVDSEAMFPK